MRARIHTRTHHINSLNSGVEVISISIVPFAKLFCTFHGNQIACSTGLLNHLHLKPWRGSLIIQIPETLPNTPGKYLRGEGPCNIAFDRLSECASFK